MEVKGMTIQDILDIDIDTIVRMKEKDLKQISSRLVSASNKRIRRLKSDKTGWGEISPALTDVKQQFSIANKTRQQTLREFVKMKRFLSAKTSTFKGWKEVRTSMFKKVGGNIDVDQYKEFWKTYRKFEETHKGGMVAVQYGLDQKFGNVVKGKKVSERILEFLKKEFDEMANSGMSFSDIMDKMNDYLDNFYQYDSPYEKDDAGLDLDGYDIPF